MQTLRRRLSSVSSGLRKVVLDDLLLPVRFPLRNLTLACAINSPHLSRGLRTQIRRAHNLSSRYNSLESNVRPEHLRRQVGEDIERPLALGEESKFSEPSQGPFLNTGVSALQMERITIKGKSILRPRPITFYGISIPPKPPPPASDDCCMSSCAICVYDLYAAALEGHQDAIVTAREQLTAKNIPKSEWPIEVLSKADRELQRDEERMGGVEIGWSLGVTGESEVDKQMAVVIGAFVEFEKTLREKRKRERAKGKDGN